MSEIRSAKLSIDPALLPGAGARVLDVGCGDGRHVAEAARRGCFAVGVDYDVGELRIARAHLGERPADLIVADAAHLPFRPAVFDAAVCTETLEHLPDDEAAMRELARVMRVGALLLGAVPTHFTELVFWRLSRAYLDVAGGHVRIYAPAVLFKRLRSTGLQPTRARYVHFVDSLVWLRFCLSDALQPARPRTDFEAAVMMAVAAERTTPQWRLRLRRALAGSRLIGALDAVGAMVWPKSLVFVAQRSGTPATTAVNGARVPAGVLAE